MARAERQQRRAQRQRARQQRRAQRQRERTRRKKTRQEMRTRRAEGRQAVRTERIKQKGASGFYSPEGIKARGQVATDLIGQGVDIAKMVSTGGLSSFGDAFGDRREKAGSFLDTVSGFFGDNSEASQSPMFGGGGGGDLAPIEEEKPFYQNPLVIGGALVGGFLLYRSFSRTRRK